MRQDVFAGSISGVPGEDFVPEVDEGTQNQGRVDRLGAELLVDEQESQNQQDDIDDGDKGTDGDIDADSLEDLGDDDRETGYGTDNQFARYEEVVDGSSRNHHAKGHDNQFYPEFFGFEDV